jgi:hypothetical protein
MLRSRPLPEATRRALQSAVQQAFGGLPAGQGLRFRSSVTSEDVQGFTAAGLYASHTGFLDPGAQLHPRDRERSVERTWASYWTFEPFEARQAAGIDHLRGRMAVVVHPRFDDERELGNGVGQLFARCQQVARAWRALDDARPDDARRAGAVTLAFDFKVTRGDWPRMAPDPGPNRLVLKQVRALEPAAGSEARSRTELLREAAARGRVLGQVK